MSMNTDYSVTPSTYAPTKDELSDSPTMIGSMNEPTVVPSNGPEVVTLVPTTSPTGIEVVFEGNNPKQNHAVSKLGLIASIIIGSMAILALIVLILLRNGLAAKNRSSEKLFVSEDASIDSPPSTTKSEYTSGEGTTSI